MAFNDDDYLRLRRMAGEPDKDTYSDTDLELMLVTAAGDFDVAAATIWREKAGSYAEMVDIAEAGSSRKNSDLYTRAIAQAEHFEQTSGTGADVPGSSTTRRIVRG